MKGYRLKIRVISLLLVSSVLIGVCPLSAEVDTDGDLAVVRSVYELMIAAKGRKANYLYDRMVPESRDLIPRQAFVTWLHDDSRMVPKGPPVIMSITFGDWRSDETGITYHDVAFVEYSVRVGSANTEEVRSATLYLWDDDGAWRWFFIEMDDSAETVADNYSWTVKYRSPYSTVMFRQIDIFWAQVFANEGINYEPPIDMIGVRVQPLITACGRETEIEKMAAAYCPIDTVIYYNPKFRDVIIDEFGGSVWASVVAHEWAHHVQALLGYKVTREPELDGGNYSVEHELQADCLTGVFVHEAHVRGLLTWDEVVAGADLLSQIGDPEDTAWDGHNAHGTGAQREQSYWTGFDDGFIGCHVLLDAEGET